MHRKLALVAERHERGQRDRAARAAVEARSRPDLTPRVARDQVLELGRKVGRARHRGVHVLVAEHRAPHLHPASMAIALQSAQVSEDEPGDGARALDVREVRGARQHHEVGALDRIGDRAAVLGWGGRIVRARDHERAGPDAREALAQVERADRVAARRIALGRRLQQHPADPVDRRGRRGPEPRREPALEHRRGDRLHAARADGRGALGPKLRRSEQRGGRAQHEPIDALGRLAREPHAHHPAQRDAAQRHALELEAVEQREQVPAEVGDRVRASRSGRAAVPAVVVAQHAEALGERRRLVVPHRERRAERAAEQHDVPVRRPGYLVLQRNRVAHPPNDRTRRR